MIADQTRYRRCSFAVHEDVLVQFKEVASLDNVSMAKAIEQFLANYIYCLDPSFIDGGEKCPQKIKKKYLVVRISADVYNACEEKTRVEKVSMNSIVEQFMTNYIDFIRTKMPLTDETMD